MRNAPQPDESMAISLGTQRPTHPPTKPNHIIMYCSLEQSNPDMASPRRHGWMKKDGRPVMGWCYNTMR